MRADDVATIESADVHLAPPPTHGAARASPQADPRGSQLAGAILVIPLTEHIASTRGAWGAREGGARSAASHPRAQLVQHKGGGEVAPLSASSPSPLAPPAFAPPRHPRELSPQLHNSVFCAAQARASPRARVSRMWVAASPPLPKLPSDTNAHTRSGRRSAAVRPPRHTDCRKVFVGGGRVANGGDASLGQPCGGGEDWGQGRPLSTSRPLAPLAVAHFRLRCSPRPLFADLCLNRTFFRLGSKRLGPIPTQDLVRAPKSRGVGVKSPCPVPDLWLGDIRPVRTRPAVLRAQLLRQSDKTVTPPPE
jgi:hypothetical protein